MIQALVIVLIIIGATLYMTHESPVKVYKVPRKRWSKRKINKELIRLMRKGEF